MAELTTVARPYAKAAFEYARGAGELAGWSSMLALAAAVVANADFNQYISRPMLSAAEQAARGRAVAKRALATGAKIARVTAHDAITNDGGSIVTLAARWDSKAPDGGVGVSKKGDAFTRWILAAPAEHTIDGTLVPTACPNAGREGTACSNLAPRHGHRTLSADRIVSITMGGVNLYTAARCACGEQHA